MFTMFFLLSAGLLVGVIGWALDKAAASKVAYGHKAGLRFKK